MSSSQSFPLTINAANCQSVLQSDGNVSIYSESQDFGICAMSIRSTTVRYATLTNKDSLFPNGVAVPAQIDASFRLGRDTSIYNTYRAYLYLNGSSVIEVSDNAKGLVTKTGTVTSGLSEINKSKEIKFGIRSGVATNRMYVYSVDLTFYFTRYDFTATAGSNVTAASVSSSTGYDGDTITYSCTLASGATFDGWYNGSTRVSTSQSYTHTVSGSDLALTAKASMPVTTKTLSATYNNAQISGFPKSTQSAVALTYGGTSKGSIPISGGTKTFECGGKLTASAIGIGGTTLNNSGKMMATDVVVTVS